MTDGTKFYLKNVKYNTYLRSDANSRVYMVQSSSFQDQFTFVKNGENYGIKNKQHGKYLGATMRNGDVKFRSWMER